MSGLKAFKAYDIRGVYGEDLNDDLAYRIGFHLPWLFNTKKILVGRDVRSSSPALFQNLCKGICDAGADVYDLGLATTPMVYYFTAKTGFDASVQITASHNPPKYNGFKISTTNARPVGYESGLDQLESMVMNTPILPNVKKGKVIEFDKRQDYISYLKTFITDIQNLNIGIDCSNGMAGLLINEVLGDSPHYINEQPDGSFPSHEPNPLEPENLKDLQDLVREKKCELGIIFDGDADRVMFVDEQSRFVEPDLIIALLGYYFSKKQNQRGKVLQDIRSSNAVKEFLEPMGFEVHTWRVGRAYAAPKLKEIDGLFGGELAGHYYFRDFFYSDSGILACILVIKTLALLKENGIRFSEFISSIRSYANSGEINFRIERKADAMEAVKNHFLNKQSPLSFMDFDGYRLDYPDFWINIRPSNTEPYLRFIAEARSECLLNSIVKEVVSIISLYS